MVLCFGSVFGSTDLGTLEKEEVAVYLVSNFWRKLHLAIRYMKSVCVLEWYGSRRMSVSVVQTSCRLYRSVL